MTTLSTTLSQLLRCPCCADPAALILEPRQNRLVCASRQHVFAFVEGFPDLRPDDLKAPAPAALPPSGI